MQRTSIATLPLHYGTAPKWLFGRMVQLADGITKIMIDEYGAEENCVEVRNDAYC